MSLKLRVMDLPPEGIEIALEMTREQAQAGLADLAGEPLTLAAALEGNLRVEKAGARILIKGRVRCAFQAVCARCLEEFILPVEEEIMVVFTPFTGEPTQEELEAEALNLEIFTGDEIDLWPFIKEHLVLGWPIKTLCREDCQGLCPVCGRNRNQGQCQCPTQSGHPGLAALKDLRDKLTN
ncbi:MAG: YceD family protein [Thermodesulfobacteriota bacterium]